MLNKFLFALAIGLCVAAAPLGAQAPAPGSNRVAGQILITRVHGGVTATDLVSGATRDIHDGDHVAEHSRVTTVSGASAILVFENGATIDLGSDTSMNIDEFRKDPFKEAVKISELKRERGTSITKLSLIRGELVGKVVHLNTEQGSEFTVDTPVGAAGIRGTTFQVVYQPAADGQVFFSVTTADGRVVLSGTTSSVSIPAGKQVSMTVKIPTGEHQEQNAEGSTPPVHFVTKDIPPDQAAFIQSIAASIVSATNSVTIGGSPSGSSSSSGSGTSSGSSSDSSSSSGASDSSSSSGGGPNPDSSGSGSEPTYQQQTTNGAGQGQ